MEPFDKLRVPLHLQPSARPVRARPVQLEHLLRLDDRSRLQLYEMQALVAAQIEDFVKFPPRQKPASFNLDAVMGQVTVTAIPDADKVLQAQPWTAPRCPGGTGPCRRRSPAWDFRAPWYREEPRIKQRMPSASRRKCAPSTSGIPIRRPSTAWKNIGGSGRTGSGAARTFISPGPPDPTGRTTPS